ncbi:Crp/Fnr family transcriptional regulator [Pedobacter sp. MW01-1-1]|uniref:Crp/Fnr family transcriptional regulator n=1 Tax=Pedobacter sp. MW01-1-1 TaxID=3383027 RepID=UPI003FF05068
MSKILNGSDALLNFFSDFQALHPALRTLLEKQTFSLKVKKNDFIASSTEEFGEHLFFIVKGLVRAFITDDQKDITTRLCSEKMLIGNNRTEEENKAVYVEKYQALEESFIQILPYSLIDKIYAQFSEANILGRKILALNAHSSTERSILSRIPSAEARFKQFKENYPELEARVPVKFLASYLGMRIETLSRIRQKSKGE